MSVYPWLNSVSIPKIFPVVVMLHSIAAICGGCGRDYLGVLSRCRASLVYVLSSTCFELEGTVVPDVRQSLNPFFGGSPTISITVHGMQKLFRFAWVSQDLYLYASVALSAYN